MNNMVKRIIRSVGIIAFLSVLLTMPEGAFADKVDSEEYPSCYVNVGEWDGTGAFAIDLNESSLYKISRARDKKTLPTPTEFKEIIINDNVVPLSSYKCQGYDRGISVIINEDYMAQLADRIYTGAVVFEKTIVPISFVVRSGSSKLGDLDGDGRPTPGDARTILRSAVGLEKNSLKSINVSDMDCDNMVSAADARIALRCAVGIDETEKYVEIAISRGLVLSTSTSRISSKPAMARSSAIYERAPFDLDSIMTGEGYKFNTAVFYGTIVDIHNTEVTWTDGDGNVWGPFDRSFLIVRVDRVMHGTLENSAIVRILATRCFADDDVSEYIEVKKGCKYVFSNCWFLDESYFSEIKANNPISYEYDISIKSADLIIGGVWCSMSPVIDDTVSVYHEYFRDIVPGETAGGEAPSSDNKRESFNKDYIMISTKQFDDEMFKLLEGYYDKDYD